AWSGALSRGTTPQAVVLGIIHSPEYQTDEVQGLYRQWLGRDAEPFGLNLFVQALQSGGSLAQVQEAILGSNDDFNRAGGSSSAFLTALYRDVLGANRSVDPVGAATFGTALANGTSRAAVANAVVGSTEAATWMVHGYYEAFLHRPPDAQGMTSFASALAHGMAAEQVLTNI